MTTEIVAVSLVNEGIKECLKSARSFSDMSKIYFSNNQGDLSLLFHYFALIEFGNAVLLRDRIKIAEYNDRNEVEITKCNNDFDKKVDAATRTAGPHVHILKNYIPSSISRDSLKDNILCYLSDFILIDYDHINKKWIKTSSSISSNEQKDALQILEKMIKKWDTIY